MDNWIDELNDRWASITGKIELNQETIKDYFVSPFLKNIGYSMDSCWYHYENNLNDGRVDIYIELMERKGEGVYVEVKRGDDRIRLEHIKQLVNYLCSPDYKHPNTKWGILTNGKEFYLMNKDIVSEKSNENGEALFDKVVLVCDLKGRKDNIKYFSKEYLFYNKKTLLMRDIAQFKAYKTYKNWDVYFSTLYGFFEYYCEELEPDLHILEEYVPSYLADIREKHFRQYLLTLKPKNKNKDRLSVNIIKAKCSHISEFYREFEKRNKITTNHFRNVRANILRQFISEGLVAEHEESENYLTRENVDIIIKKFSESSKNEGIIRLIIFGLIAYYGFTKAQVVEFLSQPWTGSIDFVNKKLIYQGIERNMPPLLEDNFKKLKKVTGKKKSILGSTGQRGQSISIDIVSATFDEIKRMQDVNGRNHFTPENTRKMFIRKLFKSGFAIEEISGYVGISLNAIEKIIGKDEIAKIGLKRWQQKTSGKTCHPFEDEFSMK